MTHFFFLQKMLLHFLEKLMKKSHIFYLAKIWKLIYCYTMAELHYLIHLRVFYSRAPLMPSNLPLHQSQVTAWVCTKAKMKLLRVK